MESTYLTLPQVARHLEAGGRKPSTCTIWRWCRKGCNGVTLKYSKFGREIRVTESDLAEFGRKLAAADKPLDTPAATATPKPKPRTAARRQRDIEAAEAVLKREGVLK